MSAEVICLTSSSSDEDAPSSPRHRVLRVASVNKSAAPVAHHGGEKMAQKRRASMAELKLDDAGSSHRKIRSVQSIPAQPGCSSDRAVDAQKVVKPQLIAFTKIIIPHPDEDVFQHFQIACLKRRDDKDTKHVLLKLEKLYSKLSTVQKQNNEFRLLISNYHNMVSKNLTKDIYTPILELRTEIKKLIKVAAVVEQQQETCDEEQFSGGDMRKIKQLESSIAMCLKKIKKLEEKDVDFDDDDNSAYIQEDKYKKRLIQLYNALSKVTGDKDLKKQLMKKKIKRSDISDEMTGIPLVDEAILTLINSDISKINQFKHLKSTQRCADYIKMPEYLDILKCIDKCSKDSNLELREEKKEKLAKRAFTAVGNFLKKKRTNETECYLQSFLDETCQDPAKEDVDLNKKLCENKKEGDKKLDEIFEKYVDLQKVLSQEDIKKQQQISSDTEDGENSSGSESEESSKQQDETKKSAEPIPKSNIISSSDADNDEKEGITEIVKCPTTANGNDDDDDDLLDITDVVVTARDPLDHQISPPAVKTKKLPQSNEILDVVKSSPQPVFYQVKSSTPSTIEAAQRNVLPPPSPRNKPIAAAVDTTSKENTGKINSCNPNKTPVIKVCAFAKPPPAWGSLSAPSSPEKRKKTFKPRQADSPFTNRRSSSPECIDLTMRREREKQSIILPRSTSTTPRSINPLANIKPTTSSPATTAASSPQSAKRVVIVKNVINNFHVPLSNASAAAAAAAAVGPRGKNIFHPSRSSGTFSKHSVNTGWLSKDKRK